MKASEIAALVLEPDERITGGPARFTGDQLRTLARAYLEQRELLRELEPIISSLTDPAAQVPGRTEKARDILPRLAAALEE